MHQMFARESLDSMQVNEGFGAFTCLFSDAAAQARAAASFKYYFFGGILTWHCLLPRLQWHNIIAIKFNLNCM